MYICVYKYVKMFLLVCPVFIIQWVYHVMNKYKFHAILSTIFSQLILSPIFSQPMFNSYSAMLSSWLYLTLLVAKWKPTLNMWWYSTSDTIPGNTPRPKSVMGRNPGITSPYAKTQDYIIFRTPTQMKYHIVCSEHPLDKIVSHRNQSINLLHKQFTGSHMARVSIGNNKDNEV